MVYSPLVMCADRHIQGDMVFSGSNEFVRFYVFTCHLPSDTLLILSIGDDEKWRPARIDLQQQARDRRDGQVRP